MSPLTEENKEQYLKDQGFEEHTMINLFEHPENPMLKITCEAIGALTLGEIINWVSCIKAGMDHPMAIKKIVADRDLAALMAQNPTFSKERCQMALGLYSSSADELNDKFAIGGIYTGDVGTVGER